MSTAWIAQNKQDLTWLMAFESRPTIEDLNRAGKGCDMGTRMDWHIYGHHIHATEAGWAKRKRAQPHPDKCPGCGRRAVMRLCSHDS
jgi:hypothetical protein